MEIGRPFLNYKDSAGEGKRDSRSVEDEGKGAYQKVAENF
jgi:hypothetical protein